MVNIVYNCFIEYIDISIGGQLIDRHYSEWFAIYHDLFEDNSKSLGLANMIGIMNFSWSHWGRTINQLKMSPNTTTKPTRIPFYLARGFVN